MTKLQFERWKDFALRMALLWPSDPVDGPSREWIRDEVCDFLQHWVPEVELVTNWDSGPAYICDRMSQWKTERVEYLMCDLVSTYTWHWMNLHVNLFCDSGRCNTGELFEGYDTPLEEELTELWSSPVMCCVRAGLDLASAPSAGVVGFTVCDLRKMYPEGIPDWINTGFKDKDDNLVDLNSGNCDVGIWL